MGELRVEAYSYGLNIIFKVHALVHTPYARAAVVSVSQGDTLWRGVPIRMRRD